MKKSILHLRGDDPDAASLLNLHLRSEKMEAEEAVDEQDFLKKANSYPYDAVLLDTACRDRDFALLLERLKEILPGMPRILYASSGKVPENLRVLCNELIHAYRDKAEVLSVLGRIAQAPLKKVAGTKENTEVSEALFQMIGASEKLEKLRKDIINFGGDKEHVLIEGPNGSGKELVAQGLHLYSPRRKKPLLTFNCANVSLDLAESTFFGSVKGAYTGSLGDTKGLFRAADGGTLFLDEIAELHPLVQSKILRAIEYGEITPVGASLPIRVDVRIIAATNRDLIKEVELGNFRRDLYFRLRILSIQVPALCERREDIPLLVEHFMERICAEREIPVKSISEEANTLLFNWDWPGNVRELNSTLIYLVVQHRAETLITGDHVREALNML